MSNTSQSDHMICKCGYLIHLSSLPDQLECHDVTLTRDQLLYPHLYNHAVAHFPGIVHCFVS